MSLGASTLYGACLQAKILSDVRTAGQQSGWQYLCSLCTFLTKRSSHSKHTRKVLLLIRLMQ